MNRDEFLSELERLLSGLPQQEQEETMQYYRDYFDDSEAGKRTTAVIFGRNTLSWIYLVNGFIAALLMIIATISFANIFWQIGALVYVNMHYITWMRLRMSEGKELNAVLGKTARLMFLISVWILLLYCFNT